jgi:hypothetical protein
MAKMKIKKTDDFQISMWKAMEWVRKNILIIVLGLAVVVAAAAFIWTRVAMARAERSHVWSRISGNASAEEFDAAARECSTASKAWLFKRKGDMLYADYIKNDALYGRRDKLVEAKKAYQEALDACSEEPNLSFGVKLAIENIDRELASSGINIDLPPLKAEGDLAPRDWGTSGASAPGK